MSPTNPYLYGLRLKITDRAFGIDTLQAVADAALAGKEEVTLTREFYRHLVCANYIDFRSDYHDSNVEALDQLDRRVRSQPVVNVTNNHTSSDASSFATGFLMGGLFNG